MTEYCISLPGKTESGRLELDACLRMPYKARCFIENCLLCNPTSTKKPFSSHTYCYFYEKERETEFSISVTTMFSKTWSWIVRKSTKLTLWWILFIKLSIEIRLHWRPTSFCYSSEIHRNDILSIIRISLLKYFRFAIKMIDTQNSEVSSVKQSGHLIPHLLSAEQIDTTFHCISIKKL